MCYISHSPLTFKADLGFLVLIYNFICSGVLSALHFNLVFVMFIEDHLLISYQHMIKQVDFFDFTSTLIPIMAGFPSFIPTPVIPWKGFGANQSQFAIQGITS